MSRRFSLLALVGAVAVAVAVAAGYSGSARSATKGVSPLPSSSCGPVVYKGSGSPDFIIPSDLPLQGAIRHQTVQISRAMIWALANAGWKAGPYKVGYQSCDDSTAQTGGWDTAKCATNAHLYANDRSVISVLGTFNSGCAKIEVPILNRAGLLAMISPANTNPGITKKWDVGEPQEVLPDGRTQLRARRRHRRHPGPGRRALVAVSGLQEGLRPERQADVRLRRRQDVPGGGQEARHQGRRLRRLGREGVELRSARRGDQEVGRAGRLPRRHHLQQRREADAGHQVRQPEDPAADA